MHFEGTLHKWTNYVSGWQSRWFVLDGGILSYYLSAEDVRLGCRGSVRMASCSLRAPPNDDLRLDIVLPGERCIYIRAVSREERQRWLVALGNSRRDNPQHSVRYVKVMELHWQCQKVITHLTNLRRFMQSHNYDDKDLLKMEQLLSESCDQFLNNLADCMETMGIESKSGGTGSGSTSEQPVADSSVGTPNSAPQSMPHTSPNSVPQSMPHASVSSLISEQPPPLDTPVEPHPETHSSFHTPDSNSTHQTPVPDYTAVVTPVTLTAQTILNSNVKSHVPMLDSSITHHEQVTENSSFTDQDPTSLIAQESFHEDVDTSTATITTVINNSTSSSQTSNADDGTAVPQKQRQPSNTFFSKLEHKFSDIAFLPNSGIPTEQFLKACEDTLPFFNLLSATAFAPVKADINGNITKLRNKYESNPGQLTTLQSMVLQELHTGTHNAKDSATDALLWLKRAMEFIQVFLSEVSAGEHDLAVAAGKAYSRSLRQHHNWVVRGLFALAVKAVPYHDQFINLLGSSEEEVLEDMQQFSDSLLRLLTVIKKLYADQKLDK